VLEAEDVAVELDRGRIVLDEDGDEVDAADRDVPARGVEGADRGVAGGLR
jgi:hypothetical protein